MKSKVLEVVLFKTKEGTNPEALKNAATAVSAFMDEQPGYEGRELAVNQDGQWADIVRWNSLENAQAAQEATMQSETCLLFFGMIDEATMKMYHFDIVA